MVDFTIRECYTMEDLRRLVQVLRGEGGCPWDREQTHASIRRDTLEEAFEVAEAIDEENPEHLKEELGDLLENVVFHADIEADAGRFTLDDVIDGVVKKLVYRHPHVFGEAVANTAGEVLTNWEAIKRQEKHQDTVTASMEAVAKSLPATWRAEKVQKKARKVGFDWPDHRGAEEKVAEELREVQAAGEETLDEELGDLLFACVNLVRLHGRDPETVLHAATDKFIRRFARVEEKAGSFTGKTLAELDALWEESKGNTVSFRESDLRGCPNIPKIEKGTEQ